jgi:hypothetical protein
MDEERMMKVFIEGEDEVKVWGTWMEPGEYNFEIDIDWEGPGR